MGGITSGTGLFSGINSANIIEQLLAIESRPKQLVQRRVAQLQAQTGGYLDINARLSALQPAASSFRINKTFQSMLATSSDPTILSATASAGAAPGTYS